jgi:hypothetical protein
MIRTIKLYGTTDDSGDLTVTADVAVVGLLHAVEWIDGSFAVGVDAVLSLDRDDDAVDITLLTLTDANADKVYYTRYLTSDDAGADLSTAGDATYAKGFVSGKLKLVVSDGGDTKTGGCIVYVEA